MHHYSLVQRKQRKVEWDSELDIMGGKKEPVWRVNFDEFINRLRIKVLFPLLFYVLASYQ